MRVCPRCRSIYASEIQRCGLDGELLTERPKDPLVGTVLDRYQLEELLGVGAMGCVYRARHTVIDRQYAIKVLYGDFATDPKFMKRFIREAQSISKIRHENIVTVDDFGSVPKGPTFIAMELVQGQTLETLIRNHAPLSPTRTAHISRQIASGLSAAHKLGFVHRDVKPSNVMLAERDGADFVKILDFGAVSLRSAPPQSTRLTNVGHIIGTPTYMAPEQSQDPAVGPTADLYALGVLMFEMLSGAPPFEGRGRAEVLVKHIMEAPPALPPSRGLDTIVQSLLEKLPERRPQSADALVKALDTMLAGPSVEPESARKAVRRSESIPTHQIVFTPTPTELSSIPEQEAPKVPVIPGVPLSAAESPPSYPQLSGDLLTPTPTDGQVQSQTDTSPVKAIDAPKEADMHTQIIRERIVPRGESKLTPTASDTTQVDFQMEFPDSPPVPTEVAQNPMRELDGFPDALPPQEDGLYAPPKPLFKQDDQAQPDSAVTQIDPSFPALPSADQGFALAQTLSQLDDSAPKLPIPGTPSIESVDTSDTLPPISYGSGEAMNLSQLNPLFPPTVESQELLPPPQSAMEVPTGDLPPILPDPQSMIPALDADTSEDHGDMSAEAKVIPIESPETTNATQIDPEEVPTPSQEALAARPFTDGNAQLSTSTLDTMPASHVDTHEMPPAQRPQAIPLPTTSPVVPTGAAPTQPTAGPGRAKGSFPRDVQERNAPRPSEAPKRASEAPARAPQTRVSQEQSQRKFLYLVILLSIIALLVMGVMYLNP